MMGNQRETARGLSFSANNAPGPVWGATVIGVLVAHLLERLKS